MSALCLSIFLLTVNTSFSNTEVNDQLILTYSYEEKSCITNAWGDGYTKKEKKAQLSVFLKKQKIKFKSIQIKMELLPHCEGCGCNTGNVFYVYVEKEFSKKIENIGFKLIEGEFYDKE